MWSIPPDHVLPCLAQYVMKYRLIQYNISKRKVLRKGKRMKLAKQNGK